MTRPRSVGNVIEREYLEELKRRVEAGPGVMAVAREAGLSRVTVWRMLSAEDGPLRMLTIDAVTRIRDAVHVLEPDGERLPPVVVGVRNPVHHAWIALADKLTSDELATLTAEPARTVATLRKDTASPSPRSRRR